MTMTIGGPAPAAHATAYRQGIDGPVAFDLDQFRGRWLVLFFYPADFTFVCPTELREFADLQEDFDAIGADVVAASTDGYHTHRAWIESDPFLQPVAFPIVADTAHELSRAFGVLDTDGTAMRGTFVIDPEGIIRHATVNDRSVGRSAAETLRVVCALQTGDLCPANWRPGLATLGIAA